MNPLHPLISTDRIADIAKEVAPEGYMTNVAVTFDELFIGFRKGNRVARSTLNVWTIRKYPSELQERFIRAAAEDAVIELRREQNERLPKENQ